MARFNRETEDTIVGALTRKEAAVLAAILWNVEGGMRGAPSLLSSICSALEDATEYPEDTIHALAQGVEIATYDGLPYLSAEKMSMILQGLEASGGIDGGRLADGDH